MPDSAKQGQTYGADNLKGLVVGDDSNSVLIGRDILKNDGTAVDAAIAMGFALSVSMPSQASLAGGGSCMIYREDRPNDKEVKNSFMEAVDFQNAPDGTPQFMRGLSFLHAQYSNKPWASLVAPAEKLARFGFTPSRNYQNDLKTASPEIQAYFQKNNADGFMINRNLADFLAELRKKPDIFIAGEGGEFFKREMQKYQGNYPNYLNSKPNFYPAPREKVGEHNAGVFQGQKLSAAMQQLLLDSTARPTNLVGTPTGTFTVDKEKLGDIMAKNTGNGTGFVAIDSFGYAVACNFNMGKKWGNGIVASNLGFMMPAKHNGELPNATIVQNPSAKVFRAGFANSAYNAHLVRCYAGLRSKDLTQSCTVAQGTNLSGVTAEAY